MRSRFERGRGETSSGRSFICRLVGLCVLVTAVCCLLSCSSTAVKGTPVNDPALVRELEGPPQPPREVRRADLERMSRVKENLTFTQVEGTPEYRVGPLDVLEINSYIGEKVTATTVTVDTRGRISYSFIDNLEVAGLTPTQIDDLLTSRLSGYIRKPRIHVLVKEFRSKAATVMGELALLRASTVGQAGSGRIYLKGKTTLTDLIAQVGGYTVNADIKNIKLIRAGRTYTINLYDIVEKGDDAQDVIVDDRDVVNVPELPTYGERVYVMGEVNAQGIYPLKEAQDLLAALALAGSYTRLAKEENTLIVRGYERGKRPLVMMADLDALLKKADLSQNIRLADGDLVYVPRMLIGDVNDWIANATPLLNFLFYPNDFESRYFMRNYLHFDRHHSR
ncbi:MAG: polysaccharide export protein [Deltaproteobacteria bacterium]|nr:polysaccharide export protein [Deltaproteobacteria bacterium]